MSTGSSRDLSSSPNAASSLDVIASRAVVICGNITDAAKKIPNIAPNMTSPEGSRVGTRGTSPKYHILLFERGHTTTIRITKERQQNNHPPNKGTTTDASKNDDIIDPFATPSHLGRPCL
jgi:hypothetical protein